MRASERDVDRVRVPPYSLEAEQSVLGGLLMDNGAWDAAADVITGSDFYRLEHQRIFAAVGALVAANRPADVITVFERLERAGHAEGIGMPYLNELAQSVPSASATRRYAEIVRDRAVLRKLIAAGDEIAASAFNPQGREVADLLDEAESRVLRIGEESARGRGAFQGMDALAARLIDRVTELAENGAGDVTGVRTGFYDLDRSTAGLQAGDLVILAARPSMGKTSLALNFAESVAIDAGLAVLVFSMEMSGDQLALRMARSQGRIDQQHLRTGRLDNEEWSRLAVATERVSAAPIHIDETPGLTITDLRARARRKARTLGRVFLIVVDYLQLMAGSGSSDGENRAAELGEISRGLKGLAKELGCPVVALSQLNRGVEQRTNKRPLMSDLRESGALEQDADVVMFIYRDEYYNADSKEPGVAEVIIAKQRCGPTGTVRLSFERSHTRFSNLDMSPRYIAGGTP